MAFVNYAKVLEEGKDRRITIGAFNTFNMESVQAVVMAADQLGAPLIVMAYYADLQYTGVDYLSAMCFVAAKNAGVDIALGLDHGKKIEQVYQCIENRFTGVMIDLSSETYETNVELTRQVISVARPRGISVEAEIGDIVDGDQSLEAIAKGFTDPEIARRFVRDTGVDCLAVSVGTAHGAYTNTPRINFALLEELIQTVPCPIVVHGGSGTPDKDVLEMVKMGVAKLNIGTDLFNAYNDGVACALRSLGQRARATEIARGGRNEIFQVAVQKLELLTKYKK